MSVTTNPRTSNRVVMPSPYAASGGVSWTNRTSPGCGTMARWPRRPRWDDDTTLVGVGSAAPLLAGRGGVRRHRTGRRLGGRGTGAPPAPRARCVARRRSRRPLAGRGALDGRDLARDRCHVAGRRPAPRAPRGCLRAPRQLRRARHVRDPACAAGDGRRGLRDGNGPPGRPFGPHGHLVRLVVSGPVARRVADERRAIGDTAR